MVDGEFISKVLSFHEGKIAICNLLDCNELGILRLDDISQLLFSAATEYKLLKPDERADFSWGDLLSLLKLARPPLKNIHSRANPIDNSLLKALRPTHTLQKSNILSVILMKKVLQVNLNYHQTLPKKNFKNI